MSDEDDFDIVTVAEVEVVIGGDGRGGTELGGGGGGACEDDPPPRVKDARNSLAVSVCRPCPFSLWLTSIVNTFYPF